MARRKVLPARISRWGIILLVESCIRDICSCNCLPGVSFSVAALHTGPPRALRPRGVSKLVTLVLKHSVICKLFVIAKCSLISLSSKNPRQYLIVLKLSHPQHISRVSGLRHNCMRIIAFPRGAVAPYSHNTVVSYSPDPRYLLVQFQHINWSPMLSFLYRFYVFKLLFCLSLPMQKFLFSIFA